MARQALLPYKAIETSAQIPNIHTAVNCIYTIFEQFVWCTRRSVTNCLLARTGATVCWEPNSTMLSLLFAILSQRVVRGNTNENWGGAKPVADTIALRRQQEVLMHFMSAV